MVPKKPQTNVKQRPDIFNYDNFENRMKGAGPAGNNANNAPTANRLQDHFGLPPFQHHHLDKVQRNNFMNDVDPLADKSNDRHVNHQVFVKQPAKRDDSV